MRIKYSKKNKIKILKEIEQKLKNQSISELLEEYKIPRPTYYTWKKRYLNKNNSLQIEKTLDII
ncbi:helix-turn-helix domain-containing protein, partial [Campylobacter lari]